MRSAWNSASACGASATPFEQERHQRRALGLARPRRTAPRSRRRSCARSSAAPACRRAAPARRPPWRRAPSRPGCSRHRERQAAQRVVAAEFEDHDRRPVLRAAAPAGASGRPTVVSPLMLALTTRGADASACARRCSSSATQPLPRGRPYSADRLSPTTRIGRARLRRARRGASPQRHARRRPAAGYSAPASGAARSRHDPAIIHVRTHHRRRARHQAGAGLDRHADDSPRHRFHAGAREVGGHRRRLGLGQEHAAVDHRRARHADHRHGAARAASTCSRSTRTRAPRCAPSARLRVPELPAARQPDRARERDAAARTAGPQRCARAGDRDAAARRPRRAAAPLSARAVGRRAAARRAGARLRREAGACCSPTSRPAASTSRPAKP